VTAEAGEAGGPGHARRHSKTGALIDSIRRPGEKEESLYDLLKREESREKEEWRRNHSLAPPRGASPPPLCSYTRTSQFLLGPPHENLTDV
jgi:hypothetical protein